MFHSLEALLSAHYHYVKVPISVSQRHVHLTQEAIDVLFGSGYALTKKNDLSQPGQYSCEETVQIVTPSASIHCRVVGPPRCYTQIELSKTDAFALGLNLPLRVSGDIAASGSGTLRGPQGTYTLREGIIVARRHIHLSLLEATQFGLSNGDTVSFAAKTRRGYHILGNVIVRSGDDHRLDVHLDTDDANALGIYRRGKGYLLLER